MQTSREVTSGETGVEIIENKPFNDPELGSCQYTYKVYHIGSKLPRIIQALAPASALKVEERAYNAYPHCKTVITSPFLGNRFKLTVESRHLPDGGTTENVFELNPDQLKQRKVELIDIKNDKAKNSDQKYDLENFRSVKTNRGPLADNWIENADPIMCAYKLVTAKFQVFGVQSRCEEFIGTTERDIFLRFHQMMFTSIDAWFQLNLEEIRTMEKQCKMELDLKLDELDLATRDRKRIKGESPLLLTSSQRASKSGHRPTLS